jgi:hypothetical protein
MPSKGRSRSSAPGRTAVSSTVAVLEGPPVAVVPAASLADFDADEASLDTPEWAEMYATAAARYREERERLDRQAEEAARLWHDFLRLQGAEVPAGEQSLADNDELHRQLLELARGEEANSYQRSDVIGDPQQTFGIEVEFDGADPQAVARALHAAGLSTSPVQRGYHSPRQPGEWVCERDSTVTGEIVSPVLRDTPETWDQLERICQILRDHGARATSRTGGHVHVGCDSANLDHDVARFRRVARVCAWAEDLMYRLAAGTGRAGRRHRGVGNGYRWCGPMRGGRFEEAGNLAELATRVGASHSVGLNFGNILDHRRTIEYRYFDSSLDPVRLQNNIRLACWVTKRAGELPDSAIPAERVPLGTHSGNAASADGDRLLRRFADLIFVRPADRLHLYATYQRTAWQQLHARAA